MKPVWKWILGILIVLLVVAALVTVPFVMRRVMVANVGPGNLPLQPRVLNGPMMRDFDRNDQKDDGQRQGLGGFGGRNFPRQGMMMGGRGFGHMGGGFFAFSPVMMIFGGLLRLIPLALFGLLLFGVYIFGKRAGARSAFAPAPVSTETVPPVTDGEEKPVE